jgi:hypothetical protein
MDNVVSLPVNGSCLIRGDPTRSPRCPSPPDTSLEIYLCCITLNQVSYPPLLDLLGRKSEGREQFTIIFTRTFVKAARLGQRRRDLCINPKSVEEVLEGREQIDRCVITGH